MKKLYIKTESGKLYSITESSNEIKMTEKSANVRPAIRYANTTILTEMPKPEKGKSCIFKFHGGAFSTDNISEYYYA